MKVKWEMSKANIILVKLNHDNDEDEDEDVEDEGVFRQLVSFKNKSCMDL